MKCVALLLWAFRDVAERRQYNTSREKCLLERHMWVLAMDIWSPWIDVDRRMYGSINFLRTSTVLQVIDALLCAVASGDARL